MALTVILEDENGKAIQQLEHELEYSDHFPKFQLLKYVDPHQDTTFNQLQMGDLIADLESLLAINTNEQGLIKEIILIAKKCHANSHSYVKFYGD